MLRMLPVVLMLFVAGDVEDDAVAILEHCRASRFDEACANFDATMKGAVPAAKLKQTWDGLTRQPDQDARGADGREGFGLPGHGDRGGRRRRPGDDRPGPQAAGDRPRASSSSATAWGARWPR